jgi:hypothetical protein
MQTLASQLSSSLDQALSFVVVSKVFPSTYQMARILDFNQQIIHFIQ